MILGTRCIVRIHGDCIITPPCSKFEGKSMYLKTWHTYDPNIHMISCVFPSAAAIISLHECDECGWHSLALARLC